MLECLILGSARSESLESLIVITWDTTASPVRSCYAWWQLYRYRNLEWRNRDTCLPWISYVLVRVTLYMYMYITNTTLPTGPGRALERECLSKSVVWWLMLMLGQGVTLTTLTMANWWFIISPELSPPVCSPELSLRNIRNINSKQLHTGILSDYLFLSSVTLYPGWAGEPVNWRQLGWY